jgi:signal transduction histidine kinase
LEQIFINLVMNAIHAIKSRESLRPGEGIIQIRAVQRGNETQVHVSDNGCGIPPDQLNKIFEPFFTTKPSGEGTGLGLSIIAKVIEEIHGRIAVASVPNEGTTFTLFFQTRCPSPTT